MPIDPVIAQIAALMTNPTMVGGARLPPANIQPIDPFHARVQRQINNAEGDDDLRRIKKRLDAQGIDTSLIPALREF